MLKIFSLIFLIFGSSFTLSFASAKTTGPLKWQGNIYKIAYEYSKVHKQFSKSVCSQGEDQKYYSLLKDYRGQGYYLPKNGDDIDKLAIKGHFGKLKAKSIYIDKVLTKLKKVKKLPAFKGLKSKLRDSLNRLLEYKKNNHVYISKKRKIANIELSRVEMKKLKTEFKQFINELYFLKSFGFPNNYLKYRRDYEYFKYTIKDQRKANKQFFFRKIYEDGAMDEDHTRSDKYLRTTLDTLYLSIMKLTDFVSEDVRYDIEWILKSTEKILNRGYAKQVERIVEWKNRVDETRSFYKNLIGAKNKQKARFLVKKENEASTKLKEFVYKKQAEVYQFWEKKSELNRALFSLETILVNEVGVMDGPTGVERAAVAKVVFNRYYDNFYNKLEKNQELAKYLDKHDDKWLNVLFKVGEFSFTYHYIGAVSNIFCPDMTRRGRAIRKQNLKIALKSARNYTGEFDAFRYFSRISMLGKIDMSTVWSDYKRLPEMTGILSSANRTLIHHYRRDKFKYFYSFTDRNGTNFDVVEIKKKIYSMRMVKGKPAFFEYRNPHLFKYFAKK